jgi:hypothetical protein
MPGACKGKLIATWRKFGLGLSDNSILQKRQATERKKESEHEGQFCLHFISPAVSFCQSALIMFEVLRALALETLLDNSGLARGGVYC